jgi:hypothetical protein
MVTVRGPGVYADVPIGVRLRFATDQRAANGRSRYIVQHYPNVTKDEKRRLKEGAGAECVAAHCSAVGSARRAGKDRSCVKTRRPGGRSVDAGPAVGEAGLVEPVES